MNKCKKCGDFIDERFEICLECKNVNSDENEVESKNKNQIKHTKQNKYNIWNMFVFPLIVCVILGYLTATEGGTQRLNPSMDGLELFFGTIGIGYSYFIFSYYPVKLIAMVMNRILEGKWIYPYRQRYLLAPICMYLLSTWLNS